MSGAQNETVATIMTALYRTFGKETNWPKNIKILKEQLSNKRWKKIKFTTPRNVRDLKNATNLTSDEQKTLDDIKQGEQELSDIKIALYDLLTKNKKFENNLLYEAITGNVKFGGNIDNESNDAPVANIIFVWDIEKLDNSKVYTIQNYIKHLQTEKHNKLKYELSYKTSGSSSSIGFRIVVK